MIFELVGLPTPKARHRYHFAKGKPISYDPQSDEKTTAKFRLKAILNNAIRSQNKEAIELSRHKAFAVDFEFHMEYPKSMSSKKRAVGLWIDKVLSKPDVDNLAKFYLDAANEILWSDDKQIIELRAKKVYSEIPKTIITVTGITQMPISEDAKGIIGFFPPSRYDEMLSDIRFLTTLESIPNRSQEQKATSAAYIISRIADRYCEDLKKINAKYPGYWKGSQNQPIMEKP